ncbi:cytidine deaminase [Alteromonas sp. ASW11-130]|uniref:cytidine deaminase n=1 Tax=Alteromonas sp. ASW11-130 TaxID=3015775 RepID=UPI002241BBF9|nr:cytidine deaminase [Alteromonas sp. ASW11-130]MCW8092147.1 cytidine deaminase [Alteromonas sp. ASW11-130]
MDNHTLKTHALAAQKNAHAPYSNFKVGVAILGSNGNVYSGCNVENVSFPLGQCAEATAIGTMVNSACTSIKKIVIVSPTDELCFPCGGCRQKIAEFADSNTEVVMFSQSGDEKVVSLETLLPFAFQMDEN